jgi:hypothetical protein
MCLIQDVNELKEEFLLGKTRRRSLCQPLPPRNEAAIYAVRNSFENYKEGAEATVDLGPVEFLRAAADNFPDQIRNSMTFCEFICDVLSKKRVPAADIVDTLAQVSEEFLQEKIQGDSPRFWSHFDDLCYLMILRGILGANQVRTIWKRFPRDHSADIVNGMKWYISDHHYFTKPVDLDRFPSDEVKDALRMPATIEQPIQPQMYTSRLIAVAIIRAVAAKVAELPEPSPDGWNRWKDYLKLVFGRQRRVFNEEVDFVIGDYDFQFTREDIVQICSA